MNPSRCGERLGAPGATGPGFTCVWMIKSMREAAPAIIIDAAANLFTRLLQLPAGVSANGFSVHFSRKSAISGNDGGCWCGFYAQNATRCVCMCVCAAAPNFPLALSYAHLYESFLFIPRCCMWRTRAARGFIHCSPFITLGKQGNKEDNLPTAIVLRQQDILTASNFFVHDNR